MSESEIKVITPLPSIECIEFARGVVQREIDRLENFAKQAAEKGEEYGHSRWKFAANMLKRDLIGFGEGCVITPLDARHLDPEWRKWYEGIWA